MQHLQIRMAFGIRLHKCLFLVWWSDAIGHCSRKYVACSNFLVNRLFSQELYKKYISGCCDKTILWMDDIQVCCRYWEFFSLST